MELRKEYRDIVDANVEGFAQGFRERIAHVALACQQLADRPPRELTDAEIERCFLKEYGLGITVTKRDIAAGRIVIEAHIAKQREPQVLKFRAARRKSDGIVQLIPASTGVNHIWEWLDADGKAQEFEVKCV